MRSFGVGEGSWRFPVGIIFIGIIAAGYLGWGVYLAMTASGSFRWIMLGFGLLFFVYAVAIYLRGRKTGIQF
jgi:hypothetical protein